MVVVAAVPSLLFPTVLLVGHLLLNLGIMDRAHSLLLLVDILGSSIHAHFGLQLSLALFLKLV